MNITVKDERHNPLLKRKEYTVIVDHAGAATPTKASLQAALAEQLTKAEDHIEVVDVVSETGVSRSLSRVFVWDEKKVQKPQKQDASKEEKQNA